MVGGLNRLLVKCRCHAVDGTFRADDYLVCLQIVAGTRAVLEVTTSPKDAIGRGTDSEMPESDCGPRTMPANRANPTRPECELRGHRESGDIEAFSLIFRPGHKASWRTPDVRQIRPTLVE
jgi:hypothetical protein